MEKSYIGITSYISSVWIPIIEASLDSLFTAQLGYDSLQKGHPTSPKGGKLRRRGCSGHAARSFLTVVSFSFSPHFSPQLVFQTGNLFEFFLFFMYIIFVYFRELFHRNMKENPQSLST